MKTLRIFLLIALVLVYSCKSSTPTEETMDSPASAALDSSKLVNLEIEVQGMTCTGCETTIETGILALPGIAGADANFVTGKTLVKADTSVTNTAGIKAAIEARGYTVKAGAVAKTPDSAAN
jgi:copper chaperone CopZ